MMPIPIPSPTNVPTSSDQTDTSPPTNNPTTTISPTETPPQPTTSVNGESGANGKQFLVLAMVGVVASTCTVMSLLLLC